MSHALASKKQPAPAKAAPAVRTSADSAVDVGEPAGLPQFLQPGGQANVQRAGQAGSPPPASAAGAGGGPSQRGSVQQIASAGLRGTASPLPHFARIQQSFGRHDISNARAHVGGAAVAANERLGSSAYTRGAAIAFRRAPDLKLAAHEAAHVVQQRRGVQLKGGVGEENDVYERQADAVAEKVVAGESAEATLDAGASGGAAGTAVQKACACGGTCPSCRAEHDAEAPIQLKLEVNATRQFESAALAAAPALEAGAPSQPAGGKAAAAPAPETAGAGGSTAEGGATGGDALEAAEATEAAGETTAPAEETPRGGEPACKGGGGLMARRYTEDYEEPPEGKEPDQEPTDPEPTQSEEEMDSDSPEPEQRDVCPIEQAIDSQAGVAAPPGAGGGSAPGGGAAGATPPPPGAPGGAAAAPSGGGGPTSGEGEATAGGAAAGTTAGGAGAAAGAAPTAAMSKAAASNAGAAQTAEASMDGAIAQTEAQRAAALTAYEAASAGLHRSSQSAQGLGGAVRFVPSATTEAERAKESNAGERASAFFAEALARVNAAVRLAQEAPDRLGSLAEGIKASIGASIETQKARISSRIASARNAALAQAESARAAVIAQHDAMIAPMQAQTEAAIVMLVGEHASATEQIDTLETDGLDRISTLYADSREAHEQKGVTVGGEAIARGEEYVNAYEQFKIHRKDGFWAGYLTDRRAEAQQKAAREVAKGYKKSLEKAAKQQARAAMQGRSKDRCGLIAAARRARGTLDAQLDALIPALESGLEQAMQAAAASRDQLLGSIDDALSGTLRTLAEQERSQRQAADDTGYLQQVAIEQAAHAAAASVQTSVSQAVVSIDQALREVRGAFVGSVALEPQSLQPLLARMSTAFGGGIEGLLERAEEGIVLAETSLGQTGARALTALAGVADSSDEQATAVSEGFSGSIGALIAGAIASFAQQMAQYTAQVTTTSSSGADGFSQVRTGFEQSVTTTTAAVESALADSAQRLDDSLHDSLRGMDCEVDKQAMKAASKEQPAWKSVVAIILIIAVIVVVALVIGPAVIGAVGAAASALGASAAAASAIGAIVGGAIVGAATSATIQVINNWSSGQDLLQGVGRAAIMGAIGGAFGGGAGFLIGKYATSAVAQFALNIAADAVLEIGTELVTGEFSWEALGMAVLMSAVTGGFGELGPVKRIQARSQAFGARAGAAVRPRTETPTPRAPSAEVGAAPKPTEAAPTPRPAEAPAAPKAAEAAPAPRAAEAPGAPRPAEAGAPEGARGQGEAPAARPTAPEAGAPAPRPAAAEAPAAPRATHQDAPEIEPGVVGKQTLPDGHEVKVLSDGRVVRCSDGCGELRLRYADDPDVLAQISRIEAIPDPKVKAKQAAELQRRLNHRDLSDADLDNLIRSNPKGTADQPSLGDELRFERYRRGGGKITEFDSWLRISRGGRAGGPGHSAKQQELIAQPDAVPEWRVPGTDRYADAYWPHGPDGKPVIHQIGGKNPSRGDPIMREREAIADIRKALGDDVDIWFHDKNNPTAPPIKNPDKLPNWGPVK